MPQTPVLVARGLGRRFGARSAVSGVDLAVQPGEMLGIVGPDGSGKTTLLQMFAAILDPSEGECTVLGLDTRRQSKAITSRIGYMSQGFTLYDRLSVEENLRFSARVRGVPRGAYGERRRRLLEMAELTSVPQRPAAKLSGGMRKKLSLCTNLIHEPDLLILDEPGLGVDPLSRRQLWDMLRAFRQRGITVVVATSYMDEAEQCDRIVLLRNGVVLEVDAPDAVRERARGRVYELRTAEPARTADALGRRAGVHGVQVLPDRVRFQLPPEAGGRLDPGALGAPTSVDPSLEDIFVMYSDESPEGGAPAAAGPAAAAVEEAGVRMDGVTVEFGRFRAVDRVSLDVAAGELLALVGPNGAGKTTLMRALCGLLPLASGGAQVAGRDVRVDPFSVRQRIGYMSQRFSLYADLTLTENLAFFANAYGLAGAAARAAVAWARQTTRLEEADDGPVAAMSGATRQRLALACSLLHRPAVLFLDEPTSGVDPVSRYSFWRLIRSLAARGMTILVSTHYLDEATYCDRIGLMLDGRMIAHGAAGELRRETASGAEATIEEVFIRAIERERRQEPAA